MKKNTSWKFTDELSVTFQLSISGAGEFGQTICDFFKLHFFLDFRFVYGRYLFGNSWWHKDEWGLRENLGKFPKTIICLQRFSVLQIDFSKVPPVNDSIYLSSFLCDYIICIISIWNWNFEMWNIHRLLGWLFTTLLNHMDMFEKNFKKSLLQTSSKMTLFSDFSIALWTFLVPKVAIKY